MLTAILISIAFPATMFLTGQLRQQALRRNKLDIPNARSSHTVPTPRGGGLAIVIVVCVAWGLSASFGLFPASLLLPLLGGGMAVAIVGYLDDQSHTSVAIRMLVHFAAALGIVLGVGSIDSLSIPGGTIDLGMAGAVIATLYIVWMLNLTNFMDGIDAIAGVEVVTAMGAAGGLLWFLGNTGLALVAWLVAAAAAGFLPWNWPPAKIFMGDVGSGFVGFCFGAIAVISHTIGSLDIYVWSILLGTFIVDATVTLIRRLFRGQRVYEAHRSHAYQHAAIRYRAHAPVSVGVSLINMLWLLPVAIAVVAGHIQGLVGLLIAYTPLVALSLYFGAGRDGQDQPDHTV